MLTMFSHERWKKVNTNYKNITEKELNAAVVQ